MDDEMRALAQRFFDAAETGDIDAVVACYSPAAEIWHNTDDVVQTPTANRETLASFVARFPRREYAERRVGVFVGGFVHQHVLRVTRPDGERVAIPAAIVCRVEGGLITRLDEYFDRAHVARLFAR